MLHMPSILYVEHIYKQEMSKRYRQSILCRARRRRCCLRGAVFDVLHFRLVRIRSFISPPGRPSTKPTDAALSHSPRYRICTPRLLSSDQRAPDAEGLSLVPSRLKHLYISLIQPLALASSHSSITPRHHSRSNPFQKPLQLFPHFLNLPSYPTHLILQLLQTPTPPSSQTPPRVQHPHPLTRREIYTGF